MCPHSCKFFFSWKQMSVLIVNISYQLVNVSQKLLKKKIDQLLYDWNFSYEFPGKGFLFWL